MKEKLEAAFGDLKCQAKAELSIVLGIFRAWSLMSESEPRAETREEETTDRTQTSLQLAGPGNASRAH